MRLTISQILLGDAAFTHVGDFLAQPVSPIPPHPVGIEVGLIRGEEPNNIAVQLRVKMDAAEAPYRFNVSYLVLMAIDEMPSPLPDDFDRRLIVTGANMTYPYAREIVSNLTGRGRFGPIWLNPTDFNESVKTAADATEQVAESSGRPAKKK